MRTRPQRDKGTSSRPDDCGDVDTPGSAQPDTDRNASNRAKLIASGGTSIHMRLLVAIKMSRCKKSEAKAGEPQRPRLNGVRDESRRAASRNARAEPR